MCEYNRPMGPIEKIMAQTTFDGVDTVVDEICTARLNGNDKPYYCEKCHALFQQQKCYRCLITKTANTQKRNIEFWGSRYADYNQ